MFVLSGGHEQDDCQPIITATLVVCRGEVRGLVHQSNVCWKVSTAVHRITNSVLMVKWLLMALSCTKCTVVVKQPSVRSLLAVTGTLICTYKMSPYTDYYL